MRVRLVVPDVLAVAPLIEGLQRDGDVELTGGTPFEVSRLFFASGALYDAALLSPFEYARHAGPYRILPGIAVSAVAPPGLSRVRIRPDARSVSSIVADGHSPSDIALKTVL